MKNEQLYREAIKYASEAEEKFLYFNERNKRITDRDARDFHHRGVVAPAAQASCAQQELIAHLFGVSDERVHEDIHALID